MRDVFVVGAVRTLVRKRNGYLSEWTATELFGFI
jgi:hypothetical protein